METKPYSLQSPEQIAKDYGGNKQKIASAAQMGLLDPTAAVMAGMFIDRMRAAQQQEQQPQQTVAQQVFAQQPPAPPPGAPPMGAPAMGAPPQAAPQQPMPPQPMPQGGQPPMGMAGGGLLDIPVSGSMFDEPANGAYAGGGLVAFADGGEVFWLPSKGRYVNADGEPVDPPAPGSTVDVGAQRLIGSGYVRSGSKYTVPEPVRPRLAVPRVTAEEMRAEFGTPRPPAPAPRRQNPAYDGAPMTPEDILAYIGSRPAPAKTALMTGPQPQAVQVPARGLGALAPQQAQAMPPMAPPAQEGVAQAGPQGPSLTAAMEEMKGLYGDLPTGARDAFNAYWERMASPEAIAAQKKQDMWSTMAQMGFNMAASNSPYFLQAVGQAGAQAVPAMQAAAKERRAMEREALQARAGIEGQQRAERADMVKGASTLYGTQVESSDRAADRASRETLAREQMALQKWLAQFEASTQMAIARIGAASGGGGSGRDRMTDYQTKVNLTYERLRADPASRGYSDATLRGKAVEIVAGYEQGGAYKSPEALLAGAASTGTEGFIVTRSK